MSAGEQLTRPLIPASKRSLQIEYAIRDVVLPARQLEAAGHTIAKFNIGDPNAYDFDTPEHIKQAVVEAMQTGHNGYAPSEGILPLRQAIVAKHKGMGVDITTDDIVVTHGVTEALQMVFTALFEEGDEILVPGPGYPPYETYVNLAGGKSVAYRTDEAAGWQPDIDDIAAKITSRTKALAIINPNNPTGALYSKEILSQIGDLALEHGLLLISDEIYDDMLLDPQATYHSTPALKPELPTIILNGISKVYLAPGWRIGYLAVRDSPAGQLAEIKDAIWKQARSRLCANSVTQHGYLAALEGPQQHIASTNALLAKRADYSTRRLRQLRGVEITPPSGAFYFFPKITHPAYQLANGSIDDKQFVLDILHECHALFVHGSGFGTDYGAGHFRGVILPPEEVQEAAFNKIEEYLLKRE